ncbi:Ig-like domain-containing protein (plasmid) [Enterobacter asburiae]|uniref:Ig-like domain-containing protein n=1 Tax=Enterobacter asburiae TaxID=61645 RepID=UPI0038560115
MRRHEDERASSIAGGMHTAGTLLDNNRPGDAAAGIARSIASGSASDAVQQWLGQAGTARARISLSEKSALNNSELDWLVPVYETQGNMLFTQLGARNRDGRNTVNAGWGMRWFMPEQMYGVNNFLDNDITGNNRRVGLGVEARTDYLSFAGNAYMRLNDWHQSRDFADYDERPANGFDLRAEGWLPAYPQLGGKLVYEKYYGHEVALFGKDERQSNPYAVTAGINWTPFPMMTVGLDERMGKGGQNETNLNLQLTWRPGESLSSQLSSDRVAATRMQQSNRYDLVERSNNIVLEYRRQDLIALTLNTSNISAPAGSRHTLSAMVRSKYPLQNVHVNADSMKMAGGEVSSIDATHFALILPQYKIAQFTQGAKSSHANSDALNTYVLTVTAEDAMGHKSPQQKLTVTVLPPELDLASLQVDNDNQPADGRSAVKVSTVLTDGSGHPVPDRQVTFTVTFADGSVDTESALTDGKGYVELNIRSRVAGVASVTVSAGDKTSSASVHFLDISTSIAPGDLVVVSDNAKADGTATNSVRATVRDAGGNPVAGATVNFTADNAAAIAATGTTLADGTVTVTLTSMKAGASVVTASTGSSSQTVSTTFVADAATAAIAPGDLVVVSDNAKADGTATNSVRATVRDAGGNPVAGATVNFTADNAAAIAATGTTLADGTVTVTLTSMKAGASVVTASTGSSSQTVSTTFVADAATAAIAPGDLVVVSDNAKADGTATNSVRATVRDAGGNPVAGATVNFTADNAAAIAATGTTLADGTVTVTLTSMKAGASVVTASTGSSSQTVSTTFVADAATAAIAPGDLVVVSDNAKADGTATNSVRATVRDAGGNPVAGATVNFTADNAAAIAATGTTLADGTVTVTLTSMKAGASVVTASTGSSSQTVSTTFVADAATAAIAPGDLVVVSDNAKADGTATNSVRATVRDAGGNPVAGATVNFTADNAAAIAATGTTLADGTVTVTLTSMKAGASVVTASTGSSSQTVSTTFVADAATAAIAPGDLVVVSDNAKADGTATNSVRATVRDAGGNPVAGATVNFTADNAAAIAATGTTLADGTVTVTLTSMKAGASVVTASTGSSSQTVSTTFVADAATAAIAPGDLVVVSDNAKADGTATNSVRATVRDAGGNPVAGATVNFTADNAAAIAATGTTLADGTVTVTLTSMKAGASVVTASTGSSSQTVSTTFVADAATAAIAPGDLVVVSDNAKADGTATNSVRATVRDAGGNPVAGATVNFTADNAAAIAATGTTLADGTVTVTLTSMKAGASVVTASTGSSSQTVSTTFVADAATAAIAPGDLVVVSDNAKADGTATNSVRATVRDAGGNPVAGATVNFTADNAAAIAATGTTLADGTVTVTLTSMKAGASVVTASTGSSSQTVSTTFVAVVVIDSADVNGYIFTADKGFPQTGFKNASFVLRLNASSALNSNYTWASNRAWVHVSNNAVVTFVGEPTITTKNVTITATPKTGGSALTYSFTVKKWFTNSGPTKLEFADATSFCSSYGVIPMRADLESNSRGIVGNLVSEWGNLKQGYSTSEFVDSDSYWTQSPGTYGKVTVFLRSPTISSSVVPDFAVHAVCLREL